MIPVNDHAWETLAQTELATADESASPQLFLRVAAAYEQGGFPEVALALLRQTASFGIEPSAMLPALLSGYRKQRLFAELNETIQAALSIRARDAGLRRELALALLSLGRDQSADLEWAPLIRDGTMRGEDWLNCARFFAARAESGALEQSMAALAQRPDLHCFHAASYCLAKHFADRNVTAALEVLGRTDPAAIPDSDVQLDLAILAFRLGDFAKAQAASSLAVTGAGDASAARRVLATARSFTGDFSSLEPMALPVSSAAQELISAHTLTVQPGAAAWGVVHRPVKGPLKAKLLKLSAEPDMAVPEDIEPVATFSLLPAEQQGDLLRLLGGVDWTWPHLMVQRRSEGDLLHYFVEAPGHQSWLWQEVLNQRNEAAAPSRGSGGHHSSVLWARARHELALHNEDQP